MFRDIEIEKRKFHHQKKKSILLEDVNIEKIFISDK